MAGDTVITIVGNVTGDPELRFTPSGAAVANFTVASTPRAFDRQSNEWKDGETLFMRCSVWRDAAENVAESIQRGARVIVTGRLKSRSYETKEGEKRTVVELEVDEVGPSLRYATAKVNKTQRGGSGGGFGGQAAGGYAAPEADPWASGAAGASGGPGHGGQGAASPGTYGQPAPSAPPQGQPAGGGGQGWGQGPTYDEPPF
ncbi:MAG: single-stranded DNA-binding protein [Dermatophilaceae bacterium]